MAKKSKMVVDTDDSVLNMTPMIDITFLLVVFFMLTIDLSSKEFVPVELPYAYMGQEDDKGAQDQKRLVVNLQADGTIILKSQPYDLSGDGGANPQAQNAALKALRDQLRELVKDPEYQEEDGSSSVPVLIHGDRGAQWQYVQWIMQVCAQPDVQIYKIQFAVKKPSEEE